MRGLLFSIYRSAVPTKPVPIPDTYRSFVASSFARQAPYLNLLAVSDASYPAQVLFVDWISQYAEHFQAQLQRWLATYGANARPEIGDAVETLLESDFLRVATQLDRLKVSIQAAGLTSVNFFNEQVCQTYADCLCTVIDFVEASTNEPLGTFADGDWENPFFKIGYARMRGATE